MSQVLEFRSLDKLKNIENENMEIYSRKLTVIKLSTP